MRSLLTGYRRASSNLPIVTHAADMPLVLPGCVPTRKPSSLLEIFEGKPTRTAGRTAPEDRKRCGSNLTRSSWERSFVVLVLLVSCVRLWPARRVGPERPHARRAGPVPRRHAERAALEGVKK